MSLRSMHVLERFLHILQSAHAECPEFVQSFANLLFVGAVHARTTPAFRHSVELQHHNDNPATMPILSLMLGLE